MFSSENPNTSMNPGDMDPGTSKVMAHKIVWKALPIADLLKYRDQIDKALPPRKLAEMNLEEEMILQYHSMRALYNEIVNDDQVAVNQKAQVGNSVTASLAKLTEMQGELYTQERFKYIENTLLRSLGKLPEETVQQFLKGYEKVLNRG